MGVDFYSTLGGPLIEVPKAPRSNAEGMRIESAGAVGTEGCGVWGGGFPSQRSECPSTENFSISDLKMASFDAFCVVFTV